MQTFEMVRRVRAVQFDGSEESCEAIGRLIAEAIRNLVAQPDHGIPYHLLRLNHQFKKGYWLVLGPPHGLEWVSPEAFAAFGYKPVTATGCGWALPEGGHCGEDAVWVSPGGVLYCTKHAAQARFPGS